ncbi:MAG: YicC/YloC family endoribonuclease [Thermodesulfobacteriota bacterium]
MVKSMTGYGSYQEQDEFCFQFWEIKSVNNKQLSLKWKLPSFLQFMEPDWERMVQGYAQRGRLEIRLNWKLFRSEELPLSLNKSYVDAMFNQLAILAAEKGDSFQPDYNSLLDIPYIWQETRLGESDEVVRTFESGLVKALQNWDSSRIREGEAIKPDLLNRLDKVLTWISEIDQRSALLAQEKYSALKERVSSLLQEVQEDAISQDRMLQELAHMADKLDISEELVRLRTHVNTLLEYLESRDSGGRNLDFLLQECFREINTCGNKAQDTAVSRLAVDIKTELEKCREQVQNLE